MDRSQLAPEDANLLARFRKGRCPPSAWTHEIFLRIAWLLYRTEGDRAMDRLREGRKQLSEANPDARRFDRHETLTSFWLTMIAAADGADQLQAGSSREFIWRHPELLDIDLPLQFYTRSELESEQAKDEALRPGRWRG